MLLDKLVSKWCGKCCTHTFFLAFQESVLASLGIFCAPPSEKSDVQTAAAVPRSISEAGLEMQGISFSTWPVTVTGEGKPGRSAWFGCVLQPSETTLYILFSPAPFLLL